MRILSSLAWLLLLAFPVAAADSTPKPNIILIVADDLGTFELGCYGQKKIQTPNIDRMAKDGMKFNQAYAGNAVCAPARCCLMTGKHPGHAAVRDNGEVQPEGQFPLPKSETTVAELLKNQGYATGAIGKWGLGMFGSSGDPLKRGFDFFFGYNCQRHAHSHYPKYLYRNDQRFDLKGNTIKSGDTHSHDLFEVETLKYLDDHKTKPFFLFLPYTIPHVAVQIPEKDLKQYEGKLGADPAYDGKKGYQPHPAPHAGYAAMVSRLDRTVGKIFDKLAELKLDKNTLVIFVSDNGPTFQVGGADSAFFESAGKLRGLKGSLYEGGIRIPMLAVWPGQIKPGSESEVPCAFWDFLPTFAELTGAAVPKDCDGISLLPTFRGDPKAPKHDFLYWEFPGYGGQQAVREGDWKAVRQSLGKKKIVTELYNLKTDPSETTNLAEKEPEILRRLEKLLTEQHTPSQAFPLQAIDTK